MSWASKVSIEARILQTKYEQISKPKFRYKMSCLESNWDAMQGFEDSCNQVDRSEVIENCDIAGVEKALGYGTGPDDFGMKMEDDRAVSYYKGTFNRVPAYAIVQSRIHYIWTESKKFQG